MGDEPVLEKRHHPSHGYGGDKWRMTLVQLRSVEKFYGRTPLEALRSARPELAELKGKLRRYEGGNSAWREVRERATTGPARP